MPRTRVTTPTRFISVSPMLVSSARGAGAGGGGGAGAAKDTDEGGGAGGDASRAGRGAGSGTIGGRLSAASIRASRWSNCSCLRSRRTMASDSASIRSWSGFGTLGSGLSCARLSFRVQQFVQAAFRNAACFARHLADSSPTAVSLLCDGSRLFISDYRREHGAHSERLFHVSGCSLGVGLQTLDESPIEVA